MARESLHSAACGGIMLAVGAIGGAALQPAWADGVDSGLGGACCADLEERIAELEATTVRKGNRRVSLQISGQVNRLTMFWDDGDETGVYEVDNTNSSSRLFFQGSATFSPGWSAGYRMVWEVDGATSSRVNQIDDDGPDASGLFGDADQRVDVREAFWWIRSDLYGEIRMGRHEPATDNLILFDLGRNIGASNDISLIGGGFFVRNSAIPGPDGLLTGTTLADFLPALDTARREGVMYLTPKYGGFQLLASWGEDDVWDAAVRYAGEWNNVRIVGGVGYFQNHDEEPDIFRVNNEIDRREWKGSVSFWHLLSGLFVTGAFVHREHEGDGAPDITVFGDNRPDFDYWYGAAGIAKNWFGLGVTSFYGEFGTGDDGITGRAEAGLAFVTGSDVEMWGVGIGQNIDAAAMELYVAWRQFQYDASGREVLGGPVVGVPLDDLNIVYTGARIKF